MIEAWAISFLGPSLAPVIGGLLFCFCIFGIPLILIAAMS